ncbi:xanthine dehydrogenase family protein subunit M [Virgisporangium aurantiacum]
MQVPGPFEYERATSVDHAVRLLDRLGPSARIVAGGQSLLPMMKLRLVDVDYLIDINDLHGELGYVRVDRNTKTSVVRIGAMTRHRELYENADLRRLLPIFHDAERVIADPPVRNRGTIGGSLCQADPSEDLSAVCTSLEATCVIRGPGGERTVTMTEFYRGPYETAVGPAEVLTEIRIPLRPNGSSAFEKVGRRAGDWAIVSCGVAVWLDGGVITGARVGLAAVGPDTTGIPAVSRAVRGRAPSEDLYAEAAIAADNCAPVSDQRGSAAYKKSVGLVAVATPATSAAATPATTATATTHR